MDGPSRAINPACVQSHRAQASKGLGKTPSWVEALLQDAAVREPRHTLPWMASWKNQCRSAMLVEANSKPQVIVIYTDGSVTRDRSGWGFTVKQDGRTVHEDSGAHRVTTSSLTMEVEAVTHAIQWLASQRDGRITHAIIPTDSMDLLQKVESGMGCPDWHTAMHSLQLQRLLWIYCPGHAGVSGNERADRLVSTANITSGLQLGRAEVLRGLRNFLSTDKPEHYSIDRLKERGVEKGSGRHSTLQGRERSVFNQTNIGTVSRAALGRLLRDGAERAWAFPSATMPSWAETERWNWNWNCCWITEIWLFSYLLWFCVFQMFCRSPVRFAQPGRVAADTVTSARASSDSLDHDSRVPGVCQRHQAYPAYATRRTNCCHLTDSTCVRPSLLSVFISSALPQVVIVAAGQRGNAPTVVVVASRVGLSPSSSATGRHPSPGPSALSLHQPLTVPDVSQLSVTRTVIMRYVTLI